MPEANTTPTTPSPDAELIALCTEFDHLQQDWWNLHNEGVDQVEDDPERTRTMTALKVQQDQIAPRIWATPAHTIAGVRAKVAAWVSFSPEVLIEVGSWDDRFRQTILLDLLDARSVS